MFIQQLSVFVWLGPDSADYGVEEDLYEKYQKNFIGFYVPDFYDNLYSYNNCRDVQEGGLETDRAQSGCDAGAGQGSPRSNQAWSGSSGCRRRNTKWHRRYWR